jgi:hypothetical protein
MNFIKLHGKIIFDPEDKTNKHKLQSSWKRIAMVFLEGGKNNDICKYYAWFIKRRYNIDLLEPLRGPHITFINDKESETNGKWELVKDKWNNKKIDIILNIEPRTDSSEDKSRITHCWWLNIPNEYRTELQSIRNELGMGRPYFGMHMTIGRAENFINDDYYIDGVQKAKSMNVEQSIYIHTLFKKNLLNI